MNDSELNRLARQDPALRVAPPASGSDRYQQILERAMTSTIDTPRPVTRHRPGKSRLGWWLGAVGATAAAAVAAAFVLGGPAQPASAAVNEAASRIAEVTSLRIAISNPTSGGQFAAKGEIKGADSRVVYTSNESKNESVTTVIGDDVWQKGTDGKTIKSKRTPDATLAPFAQAASHMVEAAAGDTTVEEKGNEKAGGVETRHFRMTLKERNSAAQPVPTLVKLPKSELGWFDLEEVDAYSTDVIIDIWVSDDHLIRRLSIDVPQQEGNKMVMDFSDFNQPIEIKQP